SSSSESLQFNKPHLHFYTPLQSKRISYTHYTSFNRISDSKHQPTSIPSYDHHHNITAIMPSPAAMHLPQEAEVDFFENVKYVRYMADAYLREAKLTFAELYKQHNDEIRALSSRCEEKAAECERLAGQLGDLQSEKAEVEENHEKRVQLHETAKEMLVEADEKLEKKDEEIENLKAELQLQKDSAEKNLAQKDEELRKIQDHNATLSRALSNLQSRCNGSERTIGMLQTTIVQGAGNMNAALLDIFDDLTDEGQKAQERAQFIQRSWDDKKARVHELIEELVRYYDEEIRGEKKHAQNELEKLAEEKEKELQELTEENWNLQSRVETYEREKEQLKDRVDQLEQAAKSCTCRQQPSHQRSDDDYGDSDSDDEGNDHGARGPEESRAGDGAEGAEGNKGGEGDETGEGGDVVDGGEVGDVVDGGKDHSGGPDGTEGTEGTEHGPNPHHGQHDGQDQPQNQRNNHGQPAVVSQNDNPVMNQLWWEECGLQSDVKDKMALDWARRNPEAAAQRVEGFGKMSNRRRILLKEQQKLARRILEARR
ncbi:hypothetical protein EJ03DRAFT_359691, partial [Teratosphaeria nubilosa]